MLRVLALAVVPIVMACGSATPSPTDTFAEPTPGAVASPTPSATVKPTASAGRSAPAESTPSTEPAAALDAELLHAGQLTICSAYPSSRFAELDADGKPFGVDVDIGQQLADRLGLTAVFRDEEFAVLIDRIESMQCDLTIAGQFITEARLLRIDMIPYMQGTPHVVVRDRNPLSIDALSDLCGRTVAVVGGTVYEDMLLGNGEYAGRGINEECATNGPTITVAKFPDEGAAEDALLREDADAYIGNDFITEERPDEFDLSVPLLPVRNGIGHRLGLASLDAALRETLRGMIHDGTYDAILEKYDVPQVRLTELP